MAENIFIWILLIAIIWIFVLNFYIKRKNVIKYKVSLNENEFIHHFIKFANLTCKELSGSTFEATIPIDEILYSSFYSFSTKDSLIKSDLYFIGFLKKHLDNFNIKYFLSNDSIKTKENLNNILGYKDFLTSEYIQFSFEINNNPINIFICKGSHKNLINPIAILITSKK